VVIALTAVRYVISHSVKTAICLHINAFIVVIALIAAQYVIKHSVKRAIC